MSSTLLRSGLWLVVLVLALFVYREAYADGPAREYISPQILQRAGALALLLIVAGIITSMFERTAKKLLKSRCQVCRRPIATGEMFCRQHLRHILEEEHDKTHSTKTRRS